MIKKSTQELINIIVIMLLFAWGISAIFFTIWVGKIGNKVSTYEKANTLYKQFKNTKTNEQLICRTTTENPVIFVPDKGVEYFCYKAVTIYRNQESTWTEMK